MIGKTAIRNLMNFFTTVSAPCSGKICANTTDTCIEGSCQCGKEASVVCDIDSDKPLCHLGSCVCSKSRDMFVLGDGTSRGSCFSRTEKCQSDGSCKECVDSSQCSGLSDTCSQGFQCGCGTGAACNSTLSNRCEGGTCMCGSGPACSSSNYLDTTSQDPKTKYFNELTILEFYEV